MLAVFAYFVGEQAAVNHLEVKSFEEERDAGDQTDAFDACLPGLPEEGFEEKATGSSSCFARVDDDGADFSEMRTVDVERGTADELSCFGFDDGERVYVLADLRVWAIEEGAVVGVALDELMYCFSVRELSLACS